MYLLDATGSGEVFVPQPDSRDFDEILVRTDHELTSRDRLGFRYLLDDFLGRSSWDGRNLLLFTNSADHRVQDFNLSETHIFSPRVVNELRFSYSRYVTNRAGPPDAPNAVDLGANVYNPSDMSGIRMRVFGFFDTIASDRLTLLRQNYTVADGVKWISGRHNLSLGGRYQRSLLNQETEFRSGGSLFVLGHATGHATSDFLLGRLWAFQQDAPGNKANVVNIPSVYVQDNFRAGPRLSLTFGVRWDPLLPLQERDGKFYVFDPDRFRAGETSTQFVNAPPGLFFRGDAGIPHHRHRGDLNNWAPRVGFAYDVTGDGKTSLRGAGGVFFNQRVPLQQQGGVFQNAPWGSAVLRFPATGPLSDPYRDSTNPFPTPAVPSRDSFFPSPAVVSSYDPTNKFGLFRVFSGWPTGSRLLHPADPTSPAVTSEPKRRPRNPQIPYTPVRSWATRKGNKTLINRELSL